MQIKRKMLKNLLKSNKKETPQTSDFGSNIYLVLASAKPVTWLRDPEKYSDTITQ